MPAPHHGDPHPLPPFRVAPVVGAVVVGATIVAGGAVGHRWNPSEHLFASQAFSQKKNSVSVLEHQTFPFVLMFMFLNGQSTNVFIITLPPQSLSARSSVSVA